MLSATAAKQITFRIYDTFWDTFHENTLHQKKNWPQTKSRTKLGPWTKGRVYPVMMI